jgi:Zn-dependent protease with chaperone function
MKPLLSVLWLGAVAAAIVAAGSAAAQAGGAIGDLLRRATDAASGRPGAASAAARGSSNAGDAALLPPKPSANVENKLQPDLTCKRFEEISVSQALLDYGGEQAQARMKRLLASDFRSSDLTPEDKKMLRYVSYTTVWVPTSIESGMGKLYIAATSKDRDTSPEDRSQAAQLARAQEQLQAFKSTIKDLPGNPNLVVDRKLPTGAYSQVGGLIVLSSDFLNRMDEKDPVKQLVLAHELSHLYKRHTIKEMQYQLITSSNGFGLAKKLLARSGIEGGSNPLELAKNAVTLASTTRELFEWVRGHQVTFGIDQELEADACSVQWMNRVGLDPKPLVPALAELEAVQKDNPSGYVKTHPTNAQRRSNLLAATGQKPALADQAKAARAASAPSGKVRKP